MSAAPTEKQKSVLVRVTRATARGDWYRADGSGERVTLASLYRKGLAKRRARRGKEGESNAAYEYQTSGVVMAALIAKGVSL